jgi:hypothetical protein
MENGICFGDTNYDHYDCFSNDDNDDDDKRYFLKDFHETFKTLQARNHKTEQIILPIKQARP